MLPIMGWFITFWTSIQELMDSGSFEKIFNVYRYGFFKIWIQTCDS
jgi:hypothetical protein